MALTAFTVLGSVMVESIDQGIGGVEEGLRNHRNLKQ